MHHHEGSEQEAVLESANGARVERGLAAHSEGTNEQGRSGSTKRTRPSEGRVFCPCPNSECVGKVLPISARQARRHMRSARDVLGLSGSSAAGAAAGERHWQHVSDQDEDYARVHSRARIVAPAVEQVEAADAHDAAVDPAAGSFDFDIDGGDDPFPASEPALSKADEAQQLDSEDESVVNREQLELDAADAAVEVGAGNNVGDEEHKMVCQLQILLHMTPFCTFAERVHGRDRCIG
jgi:hypothetical protein